MKPFIELIPSRRMRILICVLGIVLVEVLVFHAGVVVGSHSGFAPGYDREWGFAAPGVGNVHMPHGFMVSDHGAVGVIESMTPTSMVIQTRDGAIETIEISSTTTVTSADLSASTTGQLSSGEHVIVLGHPDQSGVITAEEVHVLPPAPQPPVSQ